MEENASLVLMDLMNNVMPSPGSGMVTPDHVKNVIPSPESGSAMSGSVNNDIPNPGSDLVLTDPLDNVPLSPSYMPTEHAHTMIPSSGFVEVGDFSQTNLPTTPDILNSDISTSDNLQSLLTPCTQIYNSSECSVVDQIQDSNEGTTSDGKIDEDSEDLVEEIENDEEVIPTDDEDDDEDDDDDDDEEDDESIDEEQGSLSDEADDDMSDDDEDDVMEGGKIDGKVMESVETTVIDESDELTPSSSMKEAKVKTTSRKRKRMKDRAKKTKKKKKRKSKISKFRKNIRGIMKEKELEAETINAQQEELERLQRLQDLKQKQMQQQTEEKDAQLKSLLQVAEDEAKTAQEDIILLDNTATAATSTLNKDKQDVIELSSDEDDLVIMPSDYQEEKDDDDMENSGSHVNDSRNRPNEFGQVLVNIGHPKEDADVFLAPQIARAIKPHQIGGVRFLYDNLVESLSRYKSSNGFGCILAHSMGLGKTIQMIGFIDSFLRCTAARRVLCIVPINTIQNWMAEFNLWMPHIDNISPEEKDEVAPRSFKILLMGDFNRTMASRAKVIGNWWNDGGVLLIGYEMYRLLSSRKFYNPKPKKTSKKGLEPEIIDIDEEDKNKIYLRDIHIALVSPGPDLVVCDEGHRIKNNAANISQALKNIRTKRRVVLTGYPLQNNMLEYWCMVDFVRPNFLGTKTEFCNMFERPITNGNCVDSTPQDKKLMRYRSHVLHSVLEGFIQRRGHIVLTLSLPPKFEYVFLIRMSPIQRLLYKTFMEYLSETGLNSWTSTNPLKAFSGCCKIWNHPDVLHKIIMQKKTDDDLDIDTDGKVIDGVPTKKKSSKKRPLTQGLTQDEGFNPFCDRRIDVLNYDWANEIMQDYIPGLLENGGKMVLLMSILEQSLMIGDKILVFSQSLFTLSVIEDILSKMDVPRPDMQEKWCKNRNYFRLDGSTASSDREKLINQFNSPDNNKVWLFLLSTRAGCLGINLVGANRVVILDASWNPCHDCQAVCRIYRYGQKKVCNVYRFVTDNSMEKKIYDRQVTKQGMSDRVVDQMNPENKFARQQVDNLMAFEDKDLPTVDFTECDKAFTQDTIMAHALKRHGSWITTVPFSIESLLLDRKDLRLTRSEKRLAKQSYVMEKKLNISYSRQSYQDYYPMIPQPAKRGYPQTQDNWSSRPGPYTRPVASVRPMMSTPVPMQPPGFRSNSDFPESQFLRPGVSIHQIITTTEIVLPGTNSSTYSNTRGSIPAGQQVFVIKTPRNVYIRTNDGKIFAVRSRDADSAGRTDQTNDIEVPNTDSSSQNLPKSVGASRSILPKGLSQDQPQSEMRPGQEPNLSSSSVVSASPTDFLSAVYKDADTDRSINQGFQSRQQFPGQPAFPRFGQGANNNPLDLTRRSQANTYSQDDQIYNRPSSSDAFGRKRQYPNNPRSIQLKPGEKRFGINPRFSVRNRFPDPRMLRGNVPLQQSGRSTLQYRPTAVERPPKTMQARVPEMPNQSSSRREDPASHIKDLLRDDSPTSMPDMSALQQLAQMSGNLSHIPSANNDNRESKNSLSQNTKDILQGSLFSESHKPVDDDEYFDFLSQYKQDDSLSETNNDSTHSTSSSSQGLNPANLPWPAQNPASSSVSLPMHMSQMPASSLSVATNTVASTGQSINSDLPLRSLLPATYSDSSSSLDAYLGSDYFTNSPHGLETEGFSGKIPENYAHAETARREMTLPDRMTATAPSMPNNRSPLGRTLYSPQSQEGNIMTSAPSIPTSLSYNSAATSISTPLSYKSTASSISTSLSYKSTAPSIPTSLSYKSTAPSIPVSLSYKSTAPCNSTSLSYKSSSESNFKVSPLARSVPFADQSMEPNLRQDDLGSLNTRLYDFPRNTQSQRKDTNFPLAVPSQFMMGDNDGFDDSSDYSLDDMAIEEWSQENSQGHVGNPAINQNRRPFNANFMPIAGPQTDNYLGKRQMFALQDKFEESPTSSALREDSNYSDSDSFDSEFSIGMQQTEELRDYPFSSDKFPVASPVSMPLTPSSHEAQPAPEDNSSYLPSTLQDP